jgi:hypothetical protein
VHHINLATPTNFDMQLIRNRREPFRSSFLNEATTTLPGPEEFQDFVKQGQNPRDVIESIQQVLPIEVRELTYACSLLPKRERLDWHKVTMKLISELHKASTTNPDDECMETDL